MSDLQSKVLKPLLYWTCLEIGKLIDTCTALSTHSSVFPSTLTKSTCSAIFDSCAKTVISSYQSVFMARNEAAWPGLKQTCNFIHDHYYLLIFALAKQSLIVPMDHVTRGLFSFLFSFLFCCFMSMSCIK